MKKLILSSVFCLFTVFAIAQQKIGHVNSQQIMSNMPDIKIIETKIQNESKKMDEMYAEMMQKAQEAAQAFQKAQKILKNHIKKGVDHASSNLSI